MKLFYHFLIFVFASIVLIACAKIFTSDAEVKVFNSNPAHSESQQNADSAKKSDVGKDFFSITNLGYKNLVRTKRWSDNQCNYNSVFYIRNVQMAINYLGRYTQQY